MPKFNRKWRGGNKVFDSKFEASLSENELSHCDFHPEERVPYTISHKYQPDFVWTDGTQTYLIEAKGRFMDSTEASKYVHIRASLDPWTELVFLFYDPTKPMPNAKVRKKCGTKRSHSDWADHHGFQWFNRETINNLFKGGKNGEL